MYYVVAQNLSLVDDEVEASQAVEMGPDDNTVSVRIQLLNSTGGMTQPLVVTVQGSNDLDAWHDLDNHYQATLSPS